MQAVVPLNEERPMFGLVPGVSLGDIKIPFFKNEKY
jgi:hypothetical protein